MQGKKFVQGSRPDLGTYGPVTKADARGEHYSSDAAERPTVWRKL
jgi:hypothetical protein